MDKAQGHDLSDALRSSEDLAEVADLVWNCLNLVPGLQALRLYHEDALVSRKLSGFLILDACTASQTRSAAPRTTLGCRHGATYGITHGANKDARFF